MAILLRLRCVWSVLRLHRDGLEDAMQALCDVSEFYNSRERYTPTALSPIEEFDIELFEKRNRE